MYTALWHGSSKVGSLISFLEVVGSGGPLMGGVCGCSTLGNKMSYISSSLPIVGVGDSAHNYGKADGLGSVHTE